MFYKYLGFFILPLLISCQSIETGSYNGEGISIDKKALQQDILKISLPAIHPSSLSIRTPNNHWYIVQDSPSSILYLPQEKFDSAKIIEIDIDSLEGVVWKEGRKMREKIFQENGEYLIYLANNLETEPENTFSMQAIINYQKTFQAVR